MWELLHTIGMQIIMSFQKNSFFWKDNKKRQTRACKHFYSFPNIYKCLLVLVTFNSHGFNFFIL